MVPGAWGMRAGSSISSCSIRSGATLQLFAWGANGKGQLGVDNDEEEEGNRFFPEEVRDVTMAT